MSQRPFLASPRSDGYAHKDPSRDKKIADDKNARRPSSFFSGCSARRLPGSKMFFGFLWIAFVEFNRETMVVSNYEVSVA